MQIHHVAFRTHDLERLRAFYTDVLGFTETRRDGERSVWLAAGDAILMLERAGANEPRELGASMELVAFEVTREERDALRAKLVATGIALDGETAFTTYVRDPDRRRIGFSHYPDQ
jgi:catechol 2,3-dioxygenase-like lactoylglutathione lyase family enzyme